DHELLHMDLRFSHSIPFDETDSLLRPVQKLFQELDLASVFPKDNVVQFLSAHVGKSTHGVKVSQFFRIAFGENNCSAFSSHGDNEFRGGSFFTASMPLDWHVASLASPL